MCFVRGSIVGREGEGSGAKGDLCPAELDGTFQASIDSLGEELVSDEEDDASVKQPHWKRSKIHSVRGLRSRDEGKRPKETCIGNGCPHTEQSQQVVVQLKRDVHQSKSLGARICYNSRGRAQGLDGVRWRRRDSGWRNDGLPGIKCVAGDGGCGKRKYETSMEIRSSLNRIPLLIRGLSTKATEREVSILDSSTEAQARCRIAPRLVEIIRTNRPGRSRSLRVDNDQENEKKNWEIHSSLATDCVESMVCEDGKNIGRTRWATKERELEKENYLNDKRESVRTEKEQDLEKENCPDHKRMSVTAIDYTSKFTVTAPLNVQEKPKEEDSHRLSQRQKQIDYGKNTLGYERYEKLVPRYSRKKGGPHTPDTRQVCSKRSWDGQIRKWRRLLHEYDPPKEDDEEDPDQLYIPSMKEQESPKASPVEDSTLDIRLGVDKTIKDTDLQIYDEWSDMDF